MIDIDWFLPTGGDSRDVLPDEFILSGYPHLEEAHWFGEGVMPLLRSSGHLATLPTVDVPVFSFR